MEPLGFRPVADVHKRVHCALLEGSALGVQEDLLKDEMKPKRF